MELFPPKYSRVFGHHITTKFGTKKEEDIPGYTEDVKVVGYADTNDGLEALVVSINDDVRKENGDLFHITWSLNPEIYKPFDSNKVVKEHQVKVNPVPISVKPKMFTGKTPHIDRVVEDKCPDPTSFIDYLKRI